MGKTSNFKLLKYILTFLIFGCTNLSFGQINLKVGYSIGYTNLDKTKSIFDRFNDNNLQAEKKLSPVKIFNGIDLGLRYKFQHFGIDLGLSSMSGSTDALNVFQSDGSLGKDEWKISIINYYLGLENYFGSFGYGVTIGTQKLKYRTDLASDSGKKVIYSESVLNSRFYLILEVPSNKISFSIRPFISTTWKPYNIKGVELVFDPQSNLPERDFDQDLIVYGLSFMFYNGPQRKY